MAELKITAADILGVLRENHQPPEWVLFDELRLGTGYSVRERGRRVLSEVEATVDAYALNCYPSKRCQHVAYEIKISRGDFTREIRQPLKRRPALLLSNQFYFVAPRGVLTAADMPIECGLIEIYPAREGYLVWKEVVSAPWRDTGPPSWHFVTALARRIAKMETTSEELTDG